MVAGGGGYGQWGRWAVENGWYWWTMGEWRKWWVHGGGHWRVRGAWWKWREWSRKSGTSGKGGNGGNGENGGFLDVWKWRVVIRIVGLRAMNSV